jgi:eukaryotic-like serine/threonine-protein kinase
VIAAGARLGPYEILGPLGAGGMGEVYRARDPRLERDVAIKVLPAELSADAGRLKRFEKEARSASALNHPNIVTIHEVGRDGSTSYIVMELVSGKTLRELLVPGPLPVRRALSIGAETAEGLAKAHAAGIVHRDLKPENLMVTEDGHVKILDFGLAKLTQAEAPEGQQTHAPTVSRGTEPGVVMGTVGYMSPEQATGLPLDFRSDQFSFGSVLYELLTGRPPFERRTRPETLAAIIREEPEAIASLAPKTPVPVRWVVERCLAKEPRERYASTEDLARDLENLKSHVSEASGAVEAIAAGPIRHGLRLAPAIILVGLLAAIGIGFVAGRRAAPERSAPSFQRLTFRRGTIGEARFAPDGQAIVYDAAWEGNPTELFTSRPGSAESRPLGFGRANLRAVSSQGEMAFVLQPVTTGVFLGGMLARAPLSGGAPREVLESVQFADWSPDGKQLAVVREVGGRRRLEYPPGKVLYDVPVSAKLAVPRVSPGGNRIAFVEGPDASVVGGSIAVIDLSGKKKVLTSPFDPLLGLIWAPGGDEIWFGAPPNGSFGGGLHAVTLSGKLRLLHASASGLRVHDVARDGRLLVTRVEGRFGISALAPGDRGERDLSWLDWSRAEDLSADGRTLLLNEEGAGGGPNASVYIRKTDGSPAVRLGEGWGTSLSSDGKWAITLPYDGSSMTVLPTGAGEARTVRYPVIESIFRARFFPGDRRVLLLAREKKHEARLYVGDRDGKELHPISPEGLRDAGCLAVSPDGELAAAVGPDRIPNLYPTSGAPPRTAPGLEAGDIPLRFSTDGRRLFVARLQHGSAMVHRVDLASGRREPWKELKASDPAGLSPSTAIQITPDGQFYAYTYRRFLDDLLLVSGLK